tara:strand:- start:390 stop:557 length:168 start_codon:yes stop_codon:yes gene_type:complete
MFKSQYVEDLAKAVCLLPEYQRKQIISVLIASMLTEKSDIEARRIYYKIVDNLTN